MLLSVMNLDFWYDIQIESEFGINNMKVWICVKTQAAV